MNRLVKINSHVYGLLVSLSKKASISPELYLEALIKKFYAEKN